MSRKRPRNPRYNEQVREALATRQRGEKTEAQLQLEEGRRRAREEQDGEAVRSLPR